MFMVDGFLPGVHVVKGNWDAGWSEYLRRKPGSARGLTASNSRSVAKEYGDSEIRRASRPWEVDWDGWSWVASAESSDRGTDTGKVREDVNWNRYKGDVRKTRNCYGVGSVAVRSPELFWKTMGIVWGWSRGDPM